MGGITDMFSTPEVSSPAQGFYSMPTGFQDAYNRVTSNINAGLGGINAGMFTPMGQTADESAAFNAMRQGFAPTAQTLSQDINMFMNPYNQHVIDTVNRESQGQNSLLNQAATRAGQQGSNRALLGANDIEQTRLNTIGNLQAQGFNSALSNVLNNLIPQRQTDASNLLGIGSFQRGLGQQQNLAPLSALQAQGGLLGMLPTSFGNSAQASSSGGDLDFGKVIGTGLSLFSDARLKENIKHIGTENGYPIYEFNYINIPEKRYVGVMAQDVEKIMPESISESEGYKKVDYDMIGVQMREVA